MFLNLLLYNKHFSYISRSQIIFHNSEIARPNIRLWFTVYLNRFGVQDESLHFSSTSKMDKLDGTCYPWLTNELLENVLKQSSESDGQPHVIDFEIYDAVGKGENYTSHLIRVLVKYSDSDNNSLKHKSFVIKTKLAPEYHKRFEKAAFFKRELVFYRDLLPNFKKYQNNFDINFKFTAIPYEISENPLYFFFEDLKTTKYRNMDRHAGLNFQATAMVFKKLAAYHAMTAKLHEEKPELLNLHKIPYLTNTEDNFVINAFMCGMQDCHELCHIWPGYQHIAYKLEKLLKVIKKTVTTTFESDADEFKVVTHGDLWTNNIMYSFDEHNHPNDVMMVDFQIGYYGSPAIDLTYLLYTSTSNDIKEREWDELIQMYHAELVRVLKSIGYSKRVPTLTEIHIQILKRPTIGILASLMLIGARHLDDVEHADLDWFVFENETSKKLRHALYEKDELRERTQYLLEFFNRKGFLDCH